jgi:hypothetical protein
MPITFDTLDELKEFCLTFPLSGKAVTAGRPKSIPSYEPKASVAAPVEIKRRGRTPKAEVAVEAPKRGRGPAIRTPKAAVKAEGSKRSKGETLTAQIQAAIQAFLDKKESFTANDVYAVLSKRNAGINKQSVITSVLKQMNGKFQHVAVTERPGNGPRPVKLYNAA